MSARELKPNQNSLDTTRFVLLKKRGISQHARSSTYSTRVLLALRAIRHVIDKVSLHWSTEVVLFVCFLLCIDPQTKTHAQMENSRKKKNDLRTATNLVLLFRTTPISDIWQTSSFVLIASTTDDNPCSRIIASLFLSAAQSFCFNKW